MTLSNTSITISIKSYLAYSSNKNGNNLSILILVACILVEFL